MVDLEEFESFVIEWSRVQAAGEGIDVKTIRFVRHKDGSPSSTGFDAESPKGELQVILFSHTGCHIFYLETGPSAHYAETLYKDLENPKDVESSLGEPPTYFESIYRVCNTTQELIEIVLRYLDRLAMPTPDGTS